MFGKVKKWLGIEGVKIELVLPPKTPKSLKKIDGKIRLYSMNPQEVTFIKVVLIERYQRGRKKEKLIDEYCLGEITLNKVVEVPAEEVFEIDFSLPFELMPSKMDKWQDKNFLFSGFVKLAKKIEGAKSDYRIEAEAKVKGTALNPFDRQAIVLK